MLLRTTPEGGAEQPPFAVKPPNAKLSHRHKAEQRPGKARAGGEGWGQGGKVRGQARRGTKQRGEIREFSLQRMCLTTLVYAYMANRDI